jgi:hypothetical protein
MAIYISLRSLVGLNGDNLHNGTESANIGAITVTSNIINM